MTLTKQLEYYDFFDNKIMELAEYWHHKWDYYHYYSKYIGSEYGCNKIYTNIQIHLYCTWSLFI